MTNDPQADVRCDYSQRFMVGGETTPPTPYRLVWWESATGPARLSRSGATESVGDVLTQLPIS